MYLTFDKVPYSCLGHDGYRDRFHNLLDHFGVRHACYATLCSDVCRYTFERHDGAGTCFFRYTCLCITESKVSNCFVMHVLGMILPNVTNLLSINHIHDHATLEHFSQPSLHSVVGGATVAIRLRSMAVGSR